MRVLMVILFSLMSTFLFNQTSEAKKRFDPNAEPIVAGGTCFSSKPDIRHAFPDKVKEIRWTRYMMGHIGEKCWHLQGDSQPVTGLKAIEQQKLFDEMMEFFHTRYNNYYKSDGKY